MKKSSLKEGRWEAASYQEAVSYIEEIPKFTKKHPLNHTREFLKRLGNPAEDRKIIHVAGTNGKGSTAAMVSSVLRKAGVKTGLYTSPHLWHFGERFQVNGTPIADEDLGRITELVLEAARNMPTMESTPMIPPPNFTSPLTFIVVGRRQSLSEKLKATSPYALYDPPP